MRHSRLALILLIVVAAACSGEPRSVAELARVGPDNVAIDGYSPVSYFQRNQAERGSREFAAEHDGITYWLTDAEQLTMFQADPERYAPAHGGWCSLMLTGSGNLTPADPQTFRILDDRLLLFWSGTYNGQPISGLSNWQSKFQDDEGERALLAKADETWQKLLAGEKRESVLFFSPADAERVNEQRRAAGKHQYE